MTSYITMPSADEYIALTKSCQNVNKLEEMVDAMVVHPDQITHDGQTLLFKVIEQFQTMAGKIMPPSRPVCLRIVEKLLKRGANPNRFRVPNSGVGTCGLSSTPMYAAVYRVHPDVVELLINHGGDPAIGGENELLHCATGYNLHGVPSYKMTLLLCTRGANMHAPFRGKTSVIKNFEEHYSKELKFPQHYKRYQEDIQAIHALFKHGLDATLRDEQRRKDDETRKQREALEQQRREEENRKRLELEEQQRKEREACEAEERRLKEAAEAKRRHEEWLASEEYKRQQAEAERVRKEQEAEAERVRKEQEVEAERVRKEQDIQRREENKEAGGSYVIWALHHIEFLNQYSAFIPDDKRSVIEASLKEWFGLGRENMPESVFEELVKGLPEQYMHMLS